jgi:SAM-dependent methyltransferase
VKPAATQAPPFVYRSEGAGPAPERLSPVDDRLRADEALKRVRKGEVLLYQGDFRNAKQLLSAMGRRLGGGAKATTPKQAFLAQRRLKEEEQRTLGHLVVELDQGYRLLLRSAPEVARACEWAWGPAPARTVTPLKTLLGVLGAEQWRLKGLAVPGLTGTLEPRYGVYTPTRHEYVPLLAEVDARGKTVFDVGTGSGVLAFVLLQQGAAQATGTDVEPAAVACARANAERLGLGGRFSAVEADGFPEGKADLVVCNPPWIPHPPRTRLDRAVYDEGGAFLGRFLDGLAAHLAAGGRGLLLLSNLPELLGLREAGWLPARIREAGLEVERQASTAPTHGRARDREDPLFEARSKEVTTLYVLRPRSGD